MIYAKSNPEFGQVFFGHVHRFVTYFLGQRAGPEKSETKLFGKNIHGCLGERRACLLGGDPSADCLSKARAARSATGWPFFHSNPQPQRSLVQKMLDRIIPIRTISNRHAGLANPCFKDADGEERCGHDTERTWINTRHKLICQKITVIARNSATPAIQPREHECS